MAVISCPSLALYSSYLKFSVNPAPEGSIDRHMLSNPLEPGDWYAEDQVGWDHRSSAVWISRLPRSRSQVWLSRAIAIFDFHHLGNNVG